MLRLLTNASVMGDQTLTLRKAWGVYDRWLEDPRVDFYPEPRNIDSGFRQATEPFAGKPASKWVGDCWLLACATGNQATLVTFDRALYEFSRKQGQLAVIPN
jgi:predicted nucleic acid-binding protein